MRRFVRSSTREVGVSDFNDVLLTALNEMQVEAQRCAEAIEQAGHQILDAGDLQAACNHVARLYLPLNHLSEGRAHLLEVLRGVGFVPSGAAG